MTKGSSVTASVAAREWSLATVFSRWLALATMAPVLVASIAGVVFLERSLARELHALVEEELSEAELRLRTSRYDTSDFSEIAAVLADEHPLVSMAWRLYDAESGKLIGEYGEPRILMEGVPGPEISDETARFGEARLYRTVELEGRIRMGLVLDGTAHLESASRYRWIALFVLVFSGILALIAGRFLASRMSDLFQRVADGVSLDAPKEAGVPPLDAAPKEIKAIALQLHELLGKIRSESEEAKTLIMSLAHELRSPVQNLIGQSEVAMMTADDVESCRVVLSSQLEELSRFGDSIDNVLSLCANPRAQRAPTEVFDLGAESAIRLGREETRGRLRNVSVTTSTAGDTSVRGDRELMLRGLRNVVANAVEWSPDRGRVDVRIRGEEDVVRITVDDDGPGVPPNLRESVFEPFFQGEKPSGRRIGYGLGLAMAKKAAETHGGSVTICESPTGGARFEFVIARTSKASGKDRE